MIAPRLFIAALSGALLLSPAAPRAGEGDLERLRSAVGRGEALPLSTLRRRLAERFPGEVVKTELEEDDGRFMYEFKVLQSGGRLVEVEMDAATGRIVDIDDDD